MGIEISREWIEAYLSKKYPGSTFIALNPMGEGVHGVGYSVAFEWQWKRQNIIIKTLFSEGFGHEYFSDRAQVLLLAHKAYNMLPKHVRSLDVVGVGKKMVSVGDCQEFFILMEEAEGETYFTDLERIKKEKKLTDQDLEKCAKLADYLAEIHKEKCKNPGLYKRRIRDTVGSGECIMGVLDTYPEVEFTTSDEITEFVRLAVTWWGKIKNRAHRLCVVHGDYHPGNIWWNESEETNDFILLDRSRGIYGEPADDVTCLSINYLFYGLRMNEDRFEGPFKELFDLFLERYLSQTKDQEMWEVMAPFFAFRATVVCNPLFYPDVTNLTRRKLFNFALNVMEDETFSPQNIPEYLRDRS
ncbi:MAG: phosphotransferase [Theionarchaea archaeon]|nr:phosphotransferase [Theionarchaea archaeon]MBU7020804.1 phosphotransferase [Theionarchaea archaeon]MBU7034800.1 phosphotransferase [Theionarchaea archaeon]MBU7040287.1 phosphotransferase [Theionarchaea archaeon]